MQPEDGFTRTLSAVPDEESLDLDPAPQVPEEGEEEPMVQFMAAEPYIELLGMPVTVFAAYKIHAQLEAALDEAASAGS